MEIQWGEFYLRAEGSTAVLLALAPVALALSIPKVVNGIKTIVYLMKRGAKRKLTLQEQIDHKYKEER